MQTRGFLLGLLLGFSVLWLGCGGGKPAESADSTESKAEDAKAEPEGGDKADEKADSGDKADDAKSDSGKSADKSADKKPSPPADDGPKPTRTAEDILKAPDVIFLFSFNDSEPKQKAEEKCSKKAGDNAKKKNECMAEAHKKFPADGHRFKKDDKDQWWWITVRQNGNKLTELHKIPVEFGEQTATSVTLKTVGKDKGKKPMRNPPAKVVFEVPNDYQIAVKDPEHGRLVFQAKVGSLSEPER